MIGVDCTGSCKSNYHMITTTTVLQVFEVVVYWSQGLHPCRWICSLMLTSCVQDSRHLTMVRGIHGQFVIIISQIGSFSWHWWNCWSSLQTCSMSTHFRGKLFSLNIWWRFTFYSQLRLNVLSEFPPFNPLFSYYWWFIIFDLIRPALEPKIFCIQDEHI
jgi:hypothetical protein